MQTQNFTGIFHGHKGEVVSRVHQISLSKHKSAEFDGEAGLYLQMVCDLCYSTLDTASAEAMKTSAANVF